MASLLASVWIGAIGHEPALRVVFVTQMGHCCACRRTLGSADFSMPNKVVLVNSSAPDCWRELQQKGHAQSYHDEIDATDIDNHRM
jgi:hypothetical protein